MRFISLKTGNTLVQHKDSLIDSQTLEGVSPIINGIPRFVVSEDDYAENFGWQWNHWENVQSESRGGTLQHTRNLAERSGLWGSSNLTAGKTLLECGMGGGDDTEVLLTLPLKEVHSFDISRSVDRAAKYLKDPRLTISQASIYEIPYPDESFDIVWCHRVIQHTPDPELAIRSVCKKVKPGGFLFIHSYKRSLRLMIEFKYKYRWLTKRLPSKVIYQFVDKWGPFFHRLNKILYSNIVTKFLAVNFVPFYKAPVGGIHSEMTDEENLEWEKLVTFDALTPAYDKPMSTKKFVAILKDEGFEISELFDPPKSPLIAQAVKVGS
jgi:2-polyprenyl-3-methyl-5-hydroxy-6-metoxy-1,4-benzoquinol methylase